MSKKFDEIEEKFWNEHILGLGIGLALVVGAMIINAVGHALGYW